MAAPDPAASPRVHVHVDAGTLWAGGAATAVVAALIAVVGVVIADGVLDVKLVTPPLIEVGESFTVQYAFTAAFLALVATGVAHLLCVATPEPRTFFSWIFWLATLAGVALPFTLEGEPEGQIAVAVINLVLGLGIWSLLMATLARSVRIHTADVHDLGGDPRNGYDLPPA
jgi:hypothetical protein